MRNYICPASVQVGGHVLEIHLKDAFATNGFHPALAGDTSAEEGTINLATRTMDGGYKHLDEMDATLCHEITHQISNTWGINLDEHQVDQVAEGWMQVLHGLGIRLIKEV